MHISLLVERFGAFANHVRDAIDRSDELGDNGTPDLYTEVGRAVDQPLVSGGTPPGSRVRPSTSAIWSRCMIGPAALIFGYRSEMA